MAEPTSRTVTGYCTIFDNIDGFRKELYVPSMNLLIHYGKASHPRSIERLDILTEDLRGLYKLRLDYWTTCWTTRKEYKEEEVDAHIEKKTKDYGCFTKVKISYENVKEVDLLVTEYESNMPPPNTYGLCDNENMQTKRKELDDQIKKLVSINIPVANYI